LNELKISDVINILEELKKNYGDVRIMTVVPYEWDEKDFIEKIEIDEYKNEVVAVIW
jgi:hypothetical protein